MGYFPRGLNCYHPADDIKVSIKYFDENLNIEVPKEWESFKYGLLYEGLKFFYKNKILNITQVPTFLGEYNHLPGDTIEAFIHIHDPAFHHGQFKEKDEFEVWFYDVLQQKYFVIGKGIFQEIINQSLRDWNTEMFVARYNKKLHLIPEADGITIDIIDAFSRLEFVKDIKLKCSKSPKYYIQVLLITDKELLGAPQLKELFNMIKYIDFGTTRYKIDYMNKLEEGKLRYRNVQIELASRNDKEFFTVDITFG